MPTPPLVAREERRASVAPRPSPTRSASFAARDWAPLHARSHSSALSHLPTIPSSPSPSSGFLTSYPNLPPSTVQSSITYSLSRLLSLPAFATLLNDPTSFASFSDYLLAFSSPLSTSLQLYGDLLRLRSLTASSASAARGVRDAYLLPGAEGEVDLPQLMEGRAALDRTARRVLERLYEGEFEGYVKHKLLAHTRMQLEKRGIEAASVAGLGEAFVLSNPRLPDQPIVCASPAFCALTGYARQDIVGRNCRFLQGQATSPEDVAAIRRAIKEHEPITRLLLNYTKDGAPFFNLLHILPIFSPDGELTYFVGGQTNVTGALTASSGLAIPPQPARDGTNGVEDEEDLLSAAMAQTSLDPSSSLSTFSPAVQRAVANPSSAPLPDTASATTTASSTSSSTPLPPPLPLDPPSIPSSPTFNLPRSHAHARTNSYTARDRRSWASAPALASPSFSAMFRFGGGGHHTASPDLNGNGDAAEGEGRREVKKVELATGTVERRMEEFTATYERVAILRAEDRRILHTTSSFLRYLGLPGSLEVNASPLVGIDILELLYSPGAGEKEKEREREEVRRKVREAMKDGKSASVQCGIRAEGKGGGRSAPTARGVLHLSPLQDYDGKAVAFVAM
ncbi:hypothetical protein JCM8097_000958 [Rhodosporidiobolus ruineniae]